jgi:PAS domain S-box-containing protein
MATRGFARREAMPMVGMVPDRKDNFYDKLHGRMVLPSSIIEFYPDATLVVDDRGKVIAWNKAMEKMTGVRADDMLGKGDYEYAVPFYGERKPMLLDMVGLPRKKVNKRYTDIVFKDGKLEAMTIKARLKGKDVVLWGTAGRLYSLDGKAMGAIESIRDVTSQKIMEEELRRQEELYRRITTSINDGIAVTDVNGLIIYVNPRAIEIVGYPGEEVIGHDFAGLVDERYRQEAIAKFRLIVAGGVISNYELELINKNGKSILTEVNGAYLKSGGGTIDGMIVAFRDIGERKKAEEALKAAHDGLERRVAERTSELAEARGMLQTVLDTVPAGILRADTATGSITYANQSAVKFFGHVVSIQDLYSPDRPFKILRPDGAFMKPEDRPLSRSIFLGEHVHDEELLVRQPDGRELSVLVSSAPIMEGDRIVGAVSSSVDITERKRIENALRESEEKFRVLAETTSSAIFIYQRGRFRYVNRATEKVTGYSSEELLSMNFWDWVHPDFRDVVKSYGHARRHGREAPARYEIKFITKAGEVRWAELIPGLIVYMKKPAILVTAVDITERKKVEEALKEAKQQAELYVDLMGHDINNMNQVAMGYLEMAMGAMPANDPVSVYIGRSFAMLQDSSRLIDNLRKVQQAVGKKLKLDIVDLGAMLSEVKSEHSMVPGREVAIDYTPCEYPVKANQLLKDVFSNIVDNAIKHSIGAVTIAIEVRTLSINSRRYCEVCIEDDGPGIPDEIKEAIFSRAKRGSTNARGSGLGLYLVRSLVEGFNGRVWAEDRVRGDHSKGSRFIVRLPASD